MKTITQFTTLAIALVLSAASAQAQQPVRRTTPKTAAQPHASVSKASAGQTKKTAVATAPAATVKTETQAPAPAPKPAPVVTRQTESRPQTTAQSTPAPARRSVASTSDRHVYVNAGVGLAAYYGGGLPLGASVEVDLKNNFSVGGSLDYFRYNYGYYSGRYTFIYAGARASYHLAEALNVQDKNFDPYVGATVGFRHAGYRDSYGYSYSDYGSGYNSGLWVGIHAGARYLFSPKIGAFAEVGYGVSALKVGLTAKF